LEDREALQTMYLALLDKLSSHAEAYGDFELGIDYGRRGLRLDRARESTHRRLMRLLYLSGDRIGAIRQFERCRQALADDLSVQPSQATVALYDQIRSDCLQESALRPIADDRRHPAVTRQSAGASAELAANLEQLQSLLIELGHRLHAVQLSLPRPR
jgi:DNA-binding SARP family transcriptional activator